MTKKDLYKSIEVIFEEIKGEGSIQLHPSREGATKFLIRNQFGELSILTQKYGGMVTRKAKVKKKKWYDCWNQITKIGKGKANYNH